MRNRTLVSMTKIKESNLIIPLRECSSSKERCDKIKEFLPETKEWPRIIQQQLLFYVHHTLKIDLGVCSHLSIDDHHQHCCFNGQKIECTCLIPQSSCVVRDKLSEYPYNKRIFI